jgi:uncharacterized protein YjbJ (UPF0337 family)
MVSQKQIEGRWDEISGKIRERWGQVTHDEVDRLKGNVDQLVGLIEQKTGETREAVESYLTELVDRGSAAWIQASESARDYGRRASRSAQDAYEHAESLMHRRPTESIATIFACGVLTGVVAGFLLNR